MWNIFFTWKKECPEIDIDWWYVWWIRWSTWCETPAGSWIPSRTNPTTQTSRTIRGRSAIACGGTSLPSTRSRGSGMWVVRTCICRDWGTRGGRFKCRTKCETFILLGCAVMKIVVWYGDFRMIRLRTYFSRKKSWSPTVFLLFQNSYLGSPFAR